LFTYDTKRNKTIPIALLTRGFVLTTANDQTNQYSFPRLTEPENKKLKLQILCSGCFTNISYYGKHEFALDVILLEQQQGVLNLGWNSIGTGFFFSFLEPRKVC
jgi:hypothetical protein